MIHGLIRRCEHFKGMSDEEIDFALAYMSARQAEYRKGEYLLHQGEPLTYFGIVLRGSVLITLDEIDGDSVLKSKVAQGESFGEPECFLKLHDLQLNIIAAEDAQILWLNADALIHPQGCPGMPVHKMLIRFITVLTRQCMALENRLQVLSKRTLRAKLTAYFSQLAAESGSDTFTVPYNRNDMAAYLNTDRSALSRELSNMRREGILQYHMNTFTLMPGYGYGSSKNG